MRKLSVLGLVCFFIFAYCESPADPEIEKALNPGIEEGAETQITFNLMVEHCGGFPEELEEIAWYVIFEIYINDGLSTYGDGLLIHTHEFGRGGGYYYEKPERDYSFIPALNFYGTRGHLGNAYERTTRFDYEVWFYFKETNIPSEFVRILDPRFLISLEPLESGFECTQTLLDSFCLDWEVGERTPSSPDCSLNRLMFRVMIAD